MATHCKDYDFLQIEPHWQTFWEENLSFKTDNVPGRPKYYVLDMFPYPSGAGLHLGHCENYAITDIVARYRRARGYNVLYPIGWDAFGLPTENYAVKTGRHPADVTRENVATFRRQLKAFGVSYDFDREIDTTDPRYFRWTQWIWLQLFRRGLAYVEEKPVWWCPALGTVLANEEVIDGVSEVGKHPVERRPLRQWVLRITVYADRLLEDLKLVDWPDSTKRMQESWIGRSEGAEILFQLERSSLDPLKVYTTRPDTLFGATYMVLAPEHPLVPALTTPAQRAAVEAYQKTTAGKSDLERTADVAKTKTGIFTGSFAINPLNGARLPIWIADYVLSGYGTGAIMAVPAHDERDFEFARQFQLPVIQVIAPDHATDATNGQEPSLPYTGEGRLIHSDGYTGLPWAEAKERITADLATRGQGRFTVNYKLRDWLFSRQRYWGEPFPIVWVSTADYAIALAAAKDAGMTLPLPDDPVTCIIDGETRHALPLPESALPLTLPKVTSYQPTGTGESPLAAITDWIDIWYQPATGASVSSSQPRPSDGVWVRARRESNTMPQWAGSCWYYLRYVDPRNEQTLASPEALAYWGTPDLYVGGAEHAVLHLLYARFWHKVLFDLGQVPMPEPFTKLFHQGIILGEDGEKMSKSRGNVASPDAIIASHGSDTLRLYLMFLGPLEAMKPWNPLGIEGVHRFLQKVWRECIGREGEVNPKITDTAGTDSPALLRLLHETIRKVGDDIEGLRFNTAISQMMIFINAVQKTSRVERSTLATFLQLLAPFAPHIAEELWTRIGGGSASILSASWPEFDPARLISAEQKIIVQINGRKRGEIMLPADGGQDIAVEAVKAHPEIATHLAGKSIRRIVFVPGKILNIVVE